jgi:hypothetical protein
MIEWKEIPDGDTWELFARDFLVELGFVIEIGPGRGADGGRDLLISEQLRGTLHSRRFKWLVSCKHFAVSGKSVSPTEETNITDRLHHHSADGFMGFYSTMPSASLVERLKQYAENGDIEAYEFFDHKKLEGRFVDTGLSKLAFRYFPESYRRMRPIQQLLGELVELKCDVCDADLLTPSVLVPFGAIIVWATPKVSFTHKEPSGTTYEKLFVVCKGRCDKTLEDRLDKTGLTTEWEDIGALCNPLLYLKNMLTYMNMLREKRYKISDDAHKRMKDIYMALAQRTLREVTAEDMSEFRNANMFS